MTVFQTCIWHISDSFRKMKQEMFSGLCVNNAQQAILAVVKENWDWTDLLRNQVNHLIITVCRSTEGVVPAGDP